VKYIVFLTSCIIVLGSCKDLPNKKEATFTISESEERLQSLDWLLGEWKRNNDQEGSSTYEYWQKESDQHYRGLGFTLRAGDTVFKEDIQILLENGKLNYVVSGVNETPTYFKFTNHTANSFVCENEANEFPKKISYVHEKESLSAVISGDGNSVEFTFDRR